MSDDEMKYTVPIPASTDPNSVGFFVQEALKNNYSVTISEGTARSITMVAVEGAKEKKAGFKEAEVRIGPSWFGFTIKWGK